MFPRELQVLLQELAGIFCRHEGIRIKDGYFELLQKDGEWMTLPPPGRISFRPKSEGTKSWDKFAVALLKEVEEYGKSGLGRLLKAIDQSLEKE